MDKTVCGKCRTEKPNTSCSANCEVNERYQRILKDLDGLNDKTFRAVINQFIGMNSDSKEMWERLEKSLKHPIIIKVVKI